MDFTDYLGEEFLFYGIDSNPYNSVFKLNDTVWEVCQDTITLESSVLGSIESVEPADYYFSKEPLAIVRIMEDHIGDGSGYRLYDVEFDHIWLRFGTDNTYSDYPKFYFKYTPIEPLTNLFKRGITSNPHYIHDPLDWLFNEREE